MITGFVNGQRLKLGAPVIAADTIDYLTAQFVFQTADWLGLEVWSHWQSGAEVYDIPLEDGRIAEAAHLNLGAGAWSVWLHGNRYADGAVVQRITTEKARIEVVPTGSLDGEPFPEIPASVAEQILARLENIEGGGSGGTVVEQVYMRVADGYIQYSTDGAVWENIIAVADLRGEPGEPGAQGEPGKSPVITLNRFDAVPGVHEGGVSIMVTNADGSFETSQIYNGSNGSDGTLGAPGADGYSPTAAVQQTDTGAVITITDKNSTTTATVYNGKDGAPGAPGQPGYTPVRGTDYWTAADQTAIVNAVLAALPAAEGVSF